MATKPDDQTPHDRGKIQLREEQLDVDIREVTRGAIRIEKTVEHQQVRDDLEIAYEVAEVERIPVGEEFDEMPQTRQEGDTTIIPIVEEVLVVTRRYRVTEELRITRRQEHRTERLETELRREVAEIHEVDETGGNTR